MATAWGATFRAIFPVLVVVVPVPRAGVLVELEVVGPVCRWSVAEDLLEHALVPVPDIGRDAPHVGKIRRPGPFPVMVARRAGVVDVEHDRPTGGGQGPA